MPVLTKNFVRIVLCWYIYIYIYIYIFNTSKLETTNEYLFFGFYFLSSSFFFTELNMFSLSFNPS